MLPAPVWKTAPVTAFDSTQWDAQVSWNPAIENNQYASNTDYTAIITLTAKKGFTFAGFKGTFTVASAKSTSNTANIITAEFANTGDTQVVSITNITEEMLPAPVWKAEPVTAFYSEQWDAQVSWNPAIENNEFASNVDYTASITFEAKTGYTFTAFTGTFTVASAKTVTKNSATSITAEFAKTGAAQIVDIRNVTTAMLPAPIWKAEPVATFSSTQWDAQVSWNPAIENNEFARATVYTATITFNAKEGFTFIGFTGTFTVESAASVTRTSENVHEAKFEMTEGYDLLKNYFTITTDDLAQSAGDVTDVRISGIEGVTGEITVYYNLSTNASPDYKTISEIPQTQATYGIYIDVTAGGAYKAATKLDLETNLVVGLRTIHESDFNVSPPEQYYVASELSTHPIQKSVTWKTPSAWNTGITPSVFYQGTGTSSSYTKNTAAPTTVGTYEVIIDIAANAGYFAAVTSLHVFGFEITDTMPELGDVTLTITFDEYLDPAAAFFTGPRQVFSLKDSSTPKQIVLDAPAINENDVRWTVNNSNQVTGKTLDISSYTGIGVYFVTLYIKVGTVEYNRTFTFEITL